MTRRFRRLLWKARMYWMFHMRDQIRAKIAAARKAHLPTKPFKEQRTAALRKETGK